MSNQDKPLGFWTTTSLVTGNMIGSGIFLLPASLALYGGVSIWGWVFSALGSLALAYMFANLARKIKGSGGPYNYTRAEFGDFMGYLVAWGYWVCMFTANAAIAIALVSYLSVFIPELKQQGIFTLCVTLGTVWFLVFINLRGVKEAGRVQLITTLLKVFPLLIIAVVGLFYLQPSHFQPWNLSEQSDFSAIASTAVLTLWAFLGLESASIPADEVENPEKNVPRAAVLGTLISACIYIPGTVAVMGLIEPSVLAQSNAPFADAAALLFGDWAYYLVGGVAVVSCFGALNGWTLCVGQVPMSAAKDGLFPQVFAEQSSKGVPVKGIVISSILVSLLVLMNFEQRLVDQFTFIILLSTLTSVLPYLVCAVVNFRMLMRDSKSAKSKPSTITLLLAVIAILFSIWIIVNMGITTIIWGFVLLAAAIPFYFIMKRSPQSVPAADKS
ncbi:amino acid permease [Thalassotalea psychrophila]|uniref:Arginine/agmatine antiporter n=1 Tax=Thalassotalea psychrophila TaxID=3065647 RepID=A0ABY9TYW3_9GAMM|nr:amino acid permease [Colwelliaceae bacterium SQ149]